MTTGMSFASVKWRKLCGIRNDIVKAVEFPHLCVYNVVCRSSAGIIPL